MSWERHPTATTGVYDLTRDGRIAAHFSILPDACPTGMGPTTVVDAVVATLNRLEADAVAMLASGSSAASEKLMRRAVLMAAGWQDEAAYDDHVAIIRACVASCSADAETRVREEYERRGWSFPLTPAQMAEWENVVLDILTDTEGRAA